MLNKLFALFFFQTEETINAEHNLTFSGEISLEYRQEKYNKSFLSDKKHYVLERQR